MAKGPVGKWVNCPECNAIAYAIITENSEIVDDEEMADGRVWVNCHDCGERFLAYYRTKG